ncbi:Uncharacterised protein [Candidatus Anstonella stagnisolia]|nr:Uncharacterised protein [Candidatus Anstonella stagnisolia]
MDAKKLYSLNTVLLLVGFVLLVAIADNINISALYGANNQYFTLFQLFAPTVGGFLGPLLGAGVVLVAELFSFIFNAKEFTLLNVLRLAPMLFATAYFALYAKKAKLGALVPLACVALFVLNPIGAQAWQYSLFWFIPLAAMLMPNNLLLRSYGATFTAHAVGGIIWLYTIPTTPAFWLALIPIVIIERTVFAVGISASYYAATTVASRVEAIRKSVIVKIEPQYAL